MAMTYPVSSPGFVKADGTPDASAAWAIYPETEQGKPVLIRTSDGNQLVTVGRTEGTLSDAGVLTTALYASDDIGTRYFLEIAGAVTPFLVNRAPTDIGTTLELPRPSGFVPYEDGWSPQLGSVADGNRVVLRIVSWIGGTGTPPPGVGEYIGATLTTDVADGSDIRGPAGAQGSQGSTGAKGDQGATGAAGVDGQQGDVGPEGSTTAYIYQEAPEGSPPADPVGGLVNADTSIVTTAPANWLTGPIVPSAGNALYFSYTIIHHTHSGEYVPVWSAVGEAGSQGPPGLTGATGSRGAKGDTGAQGGQGIQGIQGDVGAQGATGGQGVKGDQGDQGVKGDQGDQGVPGTSGGLSYNTIQDLPLHGVASDAQFAMARPSAVDADGNPAPDLAAALPRELLTRHTHDSPDRFWPASRETDRNVFINALGEVDFGPVLNAHDIFPRQSVVPDHTLPDAPEFYFLDHAITTGPRDDATLTPGFWNFSPSIADPTFGSCSVGYTTYVTPHIGSLNRNPGSLAELIGRVDRGSARRDNNVITLVPGETFSAQQINSHSQSWVTAWSTVVINQTEYQTGEVLHSGGVWFRNILDYPDDLDGAFTLNFKNATGEFYFVGAGSITTHPRGLYVWSSNGYNFVAGFSAIHPYGRGEPTELPDFPGQPYSNNLGELWLGAGEAINVPVKAVGEHARLVRTPKAIGLYLRTTIGTDAQLRLILGEGGFTWSYFTDYAGNNIFRQARGTDLVFTNWRGAWAYLNGVYPTDVQAQRAHAHSFWLGIYTSHQDAVDDYNIRFSQAIFDSLATDYYYGIRTDDTLDSAVPLGGVHKLTAFTSSGVSVDNSDRHWVEYESRDARLNWIDNNADYIANALTDAGYTFGGGGGFTFADTITWRWDANTAAEVYPHGLSRTPDGCMNDLICVVDTTTAGAPGYVVGDVIPNVHVPWRVTLVLDDTNVTIQPGSNNATFGITDRVAARGQGNFQEDKWAWRIRPYTIDALDP